MQVGNRIYYNQAGKILFQTGESQGDVLMHQENEKIFYIDLEYGDKTLENALEWHIENDKLVVDKYREKQESNEDKLLREKQELENQLLIEKDKQIGGIL